MLTCVCVCGFYSCMVTYKVVISTYSHCYLRLIVPALDQCFPLKTSSLVSPAHLMLCAVKSLILCFIHHFPRLHCCFCQSAPLESLFNVTTACIEKIRVSCAYHVLDSTLHLPALPCYCHKLDSVKFYFTLLCTGS